MPITTIAFHNFYDELNQDNRLFETSDAAIGDDLFLPFMELRKQARLRGVTVATLPTLHPAEIDAYVFVDMPNSASQAFRQAVASGKPLFLMVLESPLVRQQNYDEANYGYFRRIFTYNDALVDGKRFLKLNYCFRFPEKISNSFVNKEKLCVMIAGNKSSRHPQELYDERLTAIRWFEENQPNSFDLFGVGWDRGRIGRRLPAWLISLCPWLGRLGVPRRTSYRGTVVRKRDVMGRYRFALCYENIRDVPGYITEKLFDAFLSGTVPVYRGANNVTDHIPANCFVDLRQFPDYSSLYQYLHRMTDKQYQAYLAHIEQFMASERAWPFSCACFAETILNGIIDE